ncbi:ESPR-type extended signal peptide-containing protein [uncultured Megasphaera sp.]|uniref:ESPR-type extended signal peptide-containing protein n=1 Tax=uncultured Megasphaera sp. TaxID=165188 RepID=UPI0025996B0B|nr:ESPR-type extended signal peptide-containing protein [uncultured Megasphaera sp.]
MNKIYKVVWNKAKNCYVVASEFAKNHQTGSSRIKAASVAAVMAATMLTIGTGVIYAANVGDTSVKKTKETILYNNTKNETTQLNDPNLKHYNPGTWVHGHTAECGELTYNTTLTIGDINKVADALVENDKLLYDQDIKNVTMKNGTISLMRNNGMPVKNSIVLTGNDGNDGNDTSVTVTVGNESQTFQTGSVVTAKTDNSGKATGLTINGKSYDIKAGKTYTAGENVTIANDGTISAKDTTYSAGDNVKIDDQNKISVDLSKYAESDDVAVVYQDNDKNKSLHSTNAGTVGSSSIALGKEATTGMSSVALGDQTKATGESSTAIGVEAEATALDSIAIGGNAKANVYGGVALGTSSVADRAAGERGAFAPNDTIATDKTWNATAGAVSVGDNQKNITRQITNVAAGSEDTDAVNVAQLKQVGSQLDAVQQEAGKHTKVVKGNNITVEETDQDGQKTYKVGLNKDILLGDITGKNVSISGTNGTIETTGHIATEDRVYADKGAKLADVDITKDTLSNGRSKVVLNEGYAGMAYGNTNVVLMDNGVYLNGKVNVDKAGQIHNVTAGTADEDAVNVSQLKGVASIANKGWNLTTAHGETTTVKPGDTVDFSPEDTNLTVTNEGTNVKIGLNQDLHLTSATFGNTTTINANGLTIGHGTAGLEFSQNRVSVGGQQIHDVADGKDDTDAVNVRQLKKAADSAKTTVVAGKNIKVDADTKKDGHTEYNVSLDDDITLGDNASNEFVTVSGTKGTIWAGHSVSAGTVIMNGDSGTITGLTNTTWNGTTDNLSRAATEGQLKQVADAATSNDKRLVQNPNDSDGSYQVKENGDVTLRVEDSNKNGYNVTIKDVASKAELDKVKTDVGNVDGFHDEIKNKDTNGKPTHTSVVDAVNNLDTKVNTIQSDVTKATEEAKKHSSVSTGNGLDLDVTDNNGQKDYKVSLKDDFTLGGKDGHTGSIEFKGSEGNITASGTLTANAVSVGNTSISDTGLQIGNKTSLTEDALTIGGNTYITDKGIDANQQKISNVADGDISKDSKDAVNGSQLYATNEAIANNYNNITNLNGRISNLDNRVNKVGAGAAALAALHPLDFDPDAKWDFAAGYGNYRGANAAAVGAYYRPNEDTMFSVGGTFGNGENMVNAGVSFKLGSGSSHVSTSRVAMAKEIKELRSELEAMKSAMLDANAGKKIDTSKLQLFPDVPQNHWAYEYVAQLAGNGMIEGYPDGNFAGDRPMTRYEFAAILYRAMTKGAVLSDKLLSEFSHELEYFTVDTIAKDKAGNPTIQRVRTVKENKNK